MKKIFCVVGKSSSGKNTIYRNILAERYSDLTPIIPYTTRPRRRDEVDGADYFFVSQEEFARLEQEEQILEKREYHTTRGTWIYFTRRFRLDVHHNRILVTTPDGVRGLLKRYPPENLLVLYLTVDDKTRLLRCVEREALQPVPDYEEVCRRFLADQRDFPDDIFRSLPNVHTMDTGRDMAECMEQWRQLYETER